MKQIFDELRKQFDECSVEINGTKLLGTHTARLLLNRAELEWEKDVCEWQHKRYGFNTMCECARAFVNYEFALGFKHCPYCGRKIKISEVE